MLTIKYHSKFKRDIKLAKKRGYDLTLLEDVINILANNSPLPAKYCDHLLTGKYRSFRECHILPDWLLIYRIDNDVLTLTLSRTGSHSDLF